MAKRQRRRRRERRREHSQRPGWQTRHSVITGAGVAAGAVLGLAAPALADSQVFYVNQGGDAGDGTCDVTCTLRDAIDGANTNANQYDYVVFQGTVTGNVTLTDGEIPITDAVYIYGNGPAVNTITADDNSRIFDVNPNSGDPVGIYGLTLTGGNVIGNGGAIQNDDGILRVSDSILSGNAASGVGGAVYEAGNYHGGVYDGFAYSTFVGNHADSGGAIYAANSWGSTRQATFNDNGAPFGNGGAIAGSFGYLFDSTVAGNSAAVAGGGLAISNEIDFYGTIVANNSDSGIAADLYAPGGGYGSFDLVETTGALSFPPSIITGQDPQLGPLADNGGDTPTLKPAASSPVVDQSYSFSYYDQRLGPRIVDNPNKGNASGGNGADIGSVELSVAEGPQAGPPPPPSGGGALGGHKKCKKKKKHKSAAHIAKKKCKKKKHKRSARSAIRFHAPAKSGRAWPDARHHHPFRLGR